MAAQASEPTPRPRILTLSDLVFGLALSISALTLIGQQPSTSGQFFTALALYSLSFFIVINVWRLYSLITSALPSETPTLTSLNLVLLFLVSIEPYLFAELFTGTGNLPSTVTDVYAFDLGLMFLIISFLCSALASEERGLAPKDLLGVYKRLRNVCLLEAAIFIVSVAPIFHNYTVFTFTTGTVQDNFTLTSTLWVVALVVGWSWRRLPKSAARPSNSKPESPPAA
ncbi:MAG TPA: TMEM175 family protein [Nitrososphaerales archaeon]|nr:TMEM175 family protein [Nitrososphaerales archaeon]